MKLIRLLENSFTIESATGSMFQYLKNQQLTIYFSEEQHGTDYEISDNVTIKQESLTGDLTSTDPLLLQLPAEKAVDLYHHNVWTNDIRKIPSSRIFFMKGCVTSVIVNNLKKDVMMKIILKKYHEIFHGSDQLFHVNRFLHELEQLQQYAHLPEIEAVMKSATQADTSNSP